MYLKKMTLQVHGGICNAMIFCYCHCPSRSVYIISLILSYWRYLHRSSFCELSLVEYTAFFHEVVSRSRGGLVSLWWSAQESYNFVRIYLSFFFSFPKIFGLLLFWVHLFPVKLSIYINADPHVLHTKGYSPLAPVACWVLYAYFIYELHQAFVYEI